MRLFLFLFLIITICSGQSYPENDEYRNYRFAHIGLEDGVSPGSINSFYKETNGYLWIATSTGLNRYDGYKIDSFNPSSENSEAFQSRNCKAIFPDPLGNLWVETPLGINIFNPSTLTFSSDQLVILSQLNLPQKKVFKITKAPDGNFWFFHEDLSLSIYQTHTKSILLPKQINQELQGLRLKVTSIIFQDQHICWLIYENGLIQKINYKTFNVIDEFDHLSKKFNGSKNSFQFVLDKNEKLWIHLYEDYGLYVLDTKGKTIENLSTGEGRIRLKSNLISDLAIDSKGFIWVGSDHGGIAVINPDDFSHQFILSNKEIQNGISNNSITSIYADKAGIVWIGTFKAGIDYYHPINLRFNLEQNILTDSESLPFSDVNVFAEDKKGNIFIGTNGGGLIKWNSKTGQYKRYVNDPDDPVSISSNVIVSLLFDSKDNLWIGTYLGGLNKMTTNGFQHFKHDKDDPSSIPGDNIWDIFEDSRGLIWLGTVSNGLGIIDPDNKTFFDDSLFYGKFPLKNSYISDIEEDAEGNLWVGGDNGIDVFHPDNKYIAHFSHNPANDKSLCNNIILSIFKDSHGKIWIGTDEGLDLYDSQSKNFYHYTKDDGLPGDRIIGIIEDDQSDLWLTTPYGLVQFKIKNRKGRVNPNFVNYKKIDGLQGNSFNENAIYKNRKGEILVGGLNGFNIFNPLRFEYNKKKPKVVFTGFDLFNQNVEINEKINGRVLLEQPIGNTSKITLQHDENIFSIEFAALDFFQPSKNLYRYRLEGFDKSWQQVRSDQRKITYTNLDPGEYIFKVLSSNNDGIWNDDPAELNIVIKPPFYKTYYAYTCYAILIVAFLYLGRSQIIRKQRKAFLVEQEKRESDYIHQMDLMKIRFFTNISHEFKSPLSLILSPIEKLKAKDFGRDGNEQIEIINRNANRLLRLINQVLDLGNIKNDKLLHTSKGNIVEFIEDIVLNFEELSKNKGIPIHFEANVEKFTTVFDRDKLDKIIYNLLSNALKFTARGGKISLRLNILDLQNKEAGERTLKIECIDTGNGISEKDLEKIFDRFYKAEDGFENGQPGSGIGLSIVKEYVKLYKGTIKVQSELGKGSCFAIELPLKDLEDDSPKDNLNTRQLNLKKSEVANLLVIDDSQDFLNILTKDFEDWYNVFIASDAETGWKKTLSISPDLIICDQMMPGMSGTEFCKKIRNDSRTNHIPFILLTAKSGDDNILLAYEAGVNDFVQKPFNSRTLHSRVENLIEQRKLFRKAYSKKIKIPKVIDETEIANEDEKLSKKILYSLKANLSNSEFTVEKLALDLGVSRSFLYSKCMSLFEKSPQDLIITSRLEKGKELLIKSQLTISEIAFQTGFNNPKYFTRNFKKKYEQLPSKYRQDSKYNT